mmetsp:Transcript_20203/g.30991  ORF Transcript_20203/g.30991 Transcript_20203/m.30991 type:complete len:195 (-) Transcript_20203:13-597(-)
MYDAARQIFRRNQNQNQPTATTPSRDNNTLNREEQNEYTNRFVGWAIHNVYSHWKYDESDINECDATMEFISGMKMRHDVAIVDRIYMKECYSISDQIHNRGGLTLVSMEYFEFGRKLVSKIYKSFNEERMNNEGSNSLKKAFNEVDGDKELKLCFLHCDKITDLKEEIKMEIMKAIIKKTLHAMSNVAEIPPR